MGVRQIREATKPSNDAAWRAQYFRRLTTPDVAKRRFPLRHSAREILRQENLAAVIRLAHADFAQITSADNCRRLQGSEIFFELARGVIGFVGNG